MYEVWIALKQLAKHIFVLRFNSFKNARYLKTNF